MDSDEPQIAVDDFARRFSQRGPNLMWLLGAGASAAAGVPTAHDLIWHFKQQLYVSQRRVSPRSVEDLSNPSVRDRLQGHIDSLGSMPAADTPSEYAELFEATYPSESDRRALLDGKLSAASPSYGHLALATLMRADRARIIWTTNFDSLVADACAKVFGSTARLTSVALDAPAQVDDLVVAERWPIEVKLHGDFRSQRLKNTSDELRHQDARLRNALIDLCGRYGLVVVGYSGRDASVMDAIEEALKASHPFPGGLFWLHRRGDQLQPRVREVLALAVDSGVDASVVEIENFDEVLRDLLRLQSDIPSEELEAFAQQRRRWSPAPRITGRGGWPVVRLNALPVQAWPKTCRRIVCGVGGWGEVREAVEKAAIDVLYARVRAGVLAFGEDQELRTAFAPYGIDEFDLYEIEGRRLSRDGSGERSLMTDAITRAVARSHGLSIVGRRGSSRLLAPSDIRDAAWSDLKTIVALLGGAVPGHPGLTWREGVALHLEWASDQLWLVLEASIVFDEVSEETRGAAADFARERTVRRYNRDLNSLIEFWSARLGDAETDVVALGVSDGVDATFRVLPQSAFSRRASQ